MSILKTTNGMPVGERDFAYLVTKEAHETADIPILTKLSVLAQYTVSATICNVNKKCYSTAAAPKVYHSCLLIKL